MPLYESIFIVRPSLSDEETAAIIEKIKESVTKLGATILKAENWGKKKLAYEIQHDRRGTYVLLQFEGDGSVVSQLERLYRLEDSVIKFLTVHVDPEDLQTVGAGEAEATGKTEGAGSDDGGIQ